MHDKVIRAAFHEQVLSQYREDSTTRIVDELGLKHGSIRADIAIINGKLIGCEIKGDFDTLSRFKAQMESYNNIFDKCYLIVGDKLLNSAQDILPNWWGIISAYGEQVEFSMLREAKKNPRIDKYALAQLLWKNEAVLILEKQKDKLEKGWQKKPRAILYGYLANLYPLHKLQEIVRDTLKQREGWRGLAQL